MARMGKDQLYYKYKTDYWRKGGGFPTPTGKAGTLFDPTGKARLRPAPVTSESRGKAPTQHLKLAKEFPLDPHHRLPSTLLLPLSISEHSLVAGTSSEYRLLIFLSAWSENGMV